MVQRQAQLAPYSVRDFVHALVKPNLSGVPIVRPSCWFNPNK